ncbi:MAG: hypothetical protein ABSG31_09185 [Tepidisphaeraceae bacterium]
MRIDSSAPIGMSASIAYTLGMQYTLRKIPREVDKALRQKAFREGRSLNEVAIEALARGLGIKEETVKNHELDFAIGTWVEDPEFDKAISDQRQIDWNMWS